MGAANADQRSENGLSSIILGISSLAMKLIPAFIERVATRDETWVQTLTKSQKCRANNGSTLGTPS